MTCTIESSTRSSATSRGSSVLPTRRPSSWRPRSPRRRCTDAGAFVGVWHSTTGKIALGVLGLVVLLAIFGPLLAPYDPNFQNTQKVLAGPSAQHLLGTDYVGRDVLSRLLAGSTAVGRRRRSRPSPSRSSSASSPASLSVYLGRPFEWATLRLMDSLLALPLIIFAIAVAALLGNGLHQAMFAVGILLAPVLLPGDPGGGARLHRRPVRRGGRADGRLAAAGC